MKTTDQGLQESLTPLNRLIEVLIKDYLYQLYLCNQDQNNETLRRALIRSFFALVEGTISSLKAMIILRYKSGRCDLSPIEVSLLTEENYEVNEKGYTKVTRKNIKLESNLIFTFRIFADKFAHKEFLPDKSGQGWQAFQQMVKVRNQIMHPKKLGDLSVSVDCVGGLSHAVQWFKEQYYDLLDTISPGIKALLMGTSPTD